MKEIVSHLVLLLSWLLMWPLAVLCALSSQKERIMEDIMKNMDFRSASFSSYNAFVYVLFLDKFYRTLFYYRIGKKSKLVSWIWRSDSSFSITSGSIGGGVFCIHPTSTYLNAKTIGNNFSCRQNTTIGNKHDSRPNEKPTIGDNVSLGANTVIVGNITIGNNVIICAGTVVVKNVPDNCIVVGNPARIINN